jgi:gluconate 5-dehydrogenase
MNLGKLITTVNAIRSAKVEMESTELEGNVIVITGATGGIGKPMVDELFRNGASLVLYGRDINKLKKEFEDYDFERVLFVSGKPAEESDIKNLFEKTKDKFGRVDVLINCMGIMIDSPIEDITLSQIETTFDVNVRSSFLTCREAVKLMKLQKSGTIINIGSRISRNSNMSSNKTLYASSKYAIEGFTKALSKSVSKYNIRAICLLPATVSTFPTKKFFDYMIPARVAKVIMFIILMRDMDFDPISFKSTKQNI